MYRHRGRQRGFSNGSRPGLHQGPRNRHPIPSHVRPMRYQFPRPTQLPDELESALAIGTGRDTDLRQMNQMNQHHHQGPGVDTSHRGNYGSNQLLQSSDHLPGLQQNMQWSEYKAPEAPLGAMPPNVNVHSNQYLGLNERPNSNQAGVQVANMVAPPRDLNLSQPPGLQIGRQGQNLYTPESAGSILASFGLSNDDLEVLSHYPDDQLTPDTLPFILRDIQINKSGNQNSGPSTSSFSSSEVPSLLTVTQTPGQVIDYGHASRAKDEPKTGETFKREQLSSEKTVKMYPVSSNSNETKTKMRPSSLEPSQPQKIEDKDYRMTSIVKIDKDYRPAPPKPPKPPKPTKDYRPSSESKYNTSSKSLGPSSSSSKPQSEEKKWPRPSMISDFSGIPPKVYPHTCSLCNIKCDHELDWTNHIGTVVHTVTGKSLRNEYPDWKPNLQSCSPWTREKSLSHSGVKSRSRSPVSSPPQRKGRVETSATRDQSRRNSSQSRHSSADKSTSSKPLQTSSASRERRPASSESSAPSTRGRGVKRLADDRNVSSSTDESKHGQPHSHSKPPLKGVTKPAAKTTTVSSKSPPAKKKKVSAAVAKVTPAHQCLVYLTGIPKDASEQEVTNLVASFGKINNVILLPCSEEDNSDNGQKASVCMMKAEDAQAIATATNLCIREQPITASVAKKLEAEKSPVAVDSLPASGKNKTLPDNNSGGEAEQKVQTEKGTLLLTGLPESGWCEDDIITLVQPFWTPSDIVMATHIGKVIVPVPDKEAATKILTVHSAAPAKVKESEIKLVLLKQCIDCSTPVALFNVLMESAEPQVNTPAVSWNCLLVVTNVPDTPSAYSEVQKLIQRFGTVIKTLVIKNMVICEMATPAMALSVFKRFQMFPCIIQNNPLIFSRKPDNNVKDDNSKKRKGLTMTIGSSSVLLSDVSDKSDDDDDSDALSNPQKKAKVVTASVREKSEKSTIKGSKPRSAGGDSASKTSSSDKRPKVTEGGKGTPSHSKSSKTPSDKDRVKRPADSKTETSAKKLKEEEEYRSRKEKERAELKERQRLRVEREKVRQAKEKLESAARAKRQEKRDAEREQRHGRRGHHESSGTTSKSDSRQSSRRSKPESKKSESKTDHRDDFPFNLSDFVTVDQVGEVPDVSNSSTDPKKSTKKASTSVKKPTEKRETQTKLNESQPQVSTHPETKDDSAQAADEPVATDELSTTTGEDTAKVEQDSKEKNPLKTCEVTEKEEEEERKETNPLKMSEVIKEERKETNPVKTCEVTEQKEEEEERKETNPVKTCEVTEQKEKERKETNPVKTCEVTEQKEKEEEREVTNPVKTCEVTEQKEEEKKETNPVKTSKVIKEEKEEERKETNPVKTCEVTEQKEEEKKETNPVKTSKVIKEEKEEERKETNPVKTCEVTEQKEEEKKETNPVKTSKVIKEEKEEERKETNPVKTCKVIKQEKEEEKKETNPVKTCKVIKQEKEERKETNPVKTCETTEEEKIKAVEPKILDKPNINVKEIKVEADKNQVSEIPPPSTEVVSVKKQVKRKPSTKSSDLTSYDPKNAVGMEYLVPKSGFFCKVCNRFFSGAKEAESNHCKTLKHYENLQEYLKKPGSVKSKTNSS